MLLNRVQFNVSVYSEVFIAIIYRYLCFYTILYFYRQFIEISIYINTYFTCMKGENNAVQKMAIMGPDSV